MLCFLAMTNQAGKGDSPRNCFSQEYRDNHDDIDWSEEKPVTATEIQERKKERYQEFHDKLQYDTTFCDMMNEASEKREELMTKWKDRTNDK